MMSFATGFVQSNILLQTQILLISIASDASLLPTFFSVNSWDYGVLTVNSSGPGYKEQPNIKCKFFINWQGHPMTFFGKITVLRSKYCLKFSKSQQRLKISG